MTYLRFKYTFDLIFAVLALILLLPIYIVIGILIKLESRGPIIFKQERVGKGLRVFTMYKFRTMHINSKPIVREDGTIITIKNDQRITKIGKFLRHGLDELPQLINIIKGEMSIVGPRPDLPYQVAKFTDKQKIKYSVRPGITNLPAVSGRNELEFEKRIEIDLVYIKQLNFFLDVKIILFTIGLIFGIKMKNEVITL